MRGAALGEARCKPTETEPRHSMQLEERRMSCRWLFTPRPQAAIRGEV